MADLEQALRTQLANIEQRSGRSLAELADLAAASGLQRHGQLRDHFKQTLGLGHGDANALTHHVLGQAGAGALPPTAAAGAADSTALLDALYAGPRAGLRHLHEALMVEAQRFGPFEIAPKKGYVSLRRKKQFAMLGPATQTRFELGLNMSGVPATGRLQALPPGGMCPYVVKLGADDQVDAELLAWLRTAYDSAG